MKCEICNEDFTSTLLLIGHFKRIHGLSSLQYYDQFLRRVDEGYCVECGNPTAFKCFSKGYCTYCSAKCKANSKIMQSTAKNTCLEKYGVKNVSQNKDIKFKKIQTMKEHFGVEHHLQLESQQQKQRQTCLEKYGVRNISQNSDIQSKKALTCMEHFGVDNAFKSAKVQQKITDTKLEKYGVPHHTQSEQYKSRVKQQLLEQYGVVSQTQREGVKLKIKASILESYGVQNPSQSDKVKERKKQTCLKHFGVEHPWSSKELRDRAREKQRVKFKPYVEDLLRNLHIEICDEYLYARSLLRVRCLLCNKEYLTSYFAVQQGHGRCPNCYPKYKSIAETEILNYIKSLNLDTVENSRKIIDPLELDIFIPSKSLAIEYHGLYYHSDACLRNPKYYHLNKLNICQEKNITLIQVFEDEWIRCRSIVKARLKQILGVNDSQRLHARKCTIQPITSNIKQQFLSRYHLQGSDNSPVALGAFFNDELVAAMTLNHGSLAKGVKHGDEDVWELNRYCCSDKYHVPGVASKLLSFFKKNYEWKKIYSYADRRWSNGNMYYKLDFELDSITKPNYWYVKGIKRIHRFALRKRVDEPKDVPEWLLRVQEGYTHIWDCGNLKFKIKR